MPPGIYQICLEWSNGNFWQRSDEVQYFKKPPTKKDMIALLESQDGFRTGSFTVSMNDQIVIEGDHELQTYAEEQRAQEEERERERREREVRQRESTRIQKLVPGMYRKDGVIYKVQQALYGSGRMYAKRLILPRKGEEKGHFVFEQGAISRLSSNDLMSLEEAKEFGVIYGICCRCGRPLTNEASIEAGIGPICAGRGGWR